MKKTILTTIIAIFIIVLGSTYFLWTQFVNTPASTQDREVVYEVVPGRSFSSVAKDLEQEGVIANNALFSLYARIQGGASKMKVGEYLFRPTMRPSEILEILKSGKSIGRNFTIAEGLNIYEIADLVGRTGMGPKEEFLRWAKDPALVESLLGEKRDSLEGYLYPETYQITKYTDMKTFVRSMVQRFLANYEQIDPAVKKMGWTRHQLVTLASIVEKETGAPEERPLISSVFHNRMKKGMMLQTDPTVLYAKMRKTSNSEISITRADLMMDDDYNTYRRKGLPPGPISNPGLFAMKASISPAVSEFLYFVSQNDGRHVFSKEYGDHQKAVVKFQLDPKARQGKSWRDLNKKDAEKSKAPATRK